MHCLPREFHKTLVSVAPMSPLDTGLCCPHESGDSLSEGSEHPPRHVWQVPEIDIACISHSGLCRVPCKIEPASRWEAYTSNSGLHKLAQCSGGSEIRKSRTPVLGRVFESIRQVRQFTNSSIRHRHWDFPLPRRCARHHDQSSSWQHEYRSRVWMQAVHPVLDDAIHIARILLLALPWGSSELWICETMPAFVGAAVGRLDIVASDPTIV